MSFKCLLLWWCFITFSATHYLQCLLDRPSAVGSDCRSSSVQQFSPLKALLSFYPCKRICEDQTILKDGLEFSIPEWSLSLALTSQWDFMVSFNLKSFIHRRIWIKNCFVWIIKRLFAIWTWNWSEYYSQFAPRWSVSYLIYFVFNQFLIHCINRLAQVVKILLVIAICGNYAM